MKPKIKIYRSGDLISTTEGEIGESLFTRIGIVGLFLDSPCAGMGKCGKCKVKLRPDGEEVLACRTFIEGDMNVYLPDDMDMKIADAGTAAAQGTGGDKPEVDLDGRFGVAIDIGTTTVVAHLTDLATGTRVATASGVNAQRTYGSDVISRIQYSAANGHETLTRVIREQLSTLIMEACIASGVNGDNIDYIAIAGNTIMEHFAAGYSPVGMGVVPFTPISLFGDELEAGEDLPVAKNAKVYFAPAISSYVGGDITAGMLAAKLEDTNGPVVYLDIGTNGEICLKSGDKYYTCATAAGPAFEGAEISMGMAAVSGAINHCRWENGLILSVIGDSTPRGLCGSGLLDALSILLNAGAVDESGRMLDPDEIDHDIKEYIGEIDGKPTFYLHKGDNPVYLTAADVRKLQLAKSAIAAGIQTLLHHVGVKEEDVTQFVLAGGFGSYMNQYSAARIGLFPACFLPVSSTLGNTAGEGAAIIVYSEEGRATIADIRQRCEYIELSTSAVFNEQFVEQMLFPDEF
ncbi:MAG: ASKHA domain-containing protein [Oscillospiraceae bacterium]|nr:ASKHA domain-containing protein [Oscillospiraceae bacterium]